MRSLTILIISLTLITGFAKSSKTLTIYAIDVEGGKSTLFVSPTRESLLIDTGNIGEGMKRDVERILAAMKDAGIEQIDHLVTTHWDRDHFGGTALLASHIPIREFIDHGPSVESNAQIDDFQRLTYPTLYAKAIHIIAKPGTRIEVNGLDILVVTSAGNVITSLLPGASKPNPYCSSYKSQNMKMTEDAQSIGVLITFGKFRVLDLGDLTANKEFDLMCPDNPIGTVDLFMVSHHGQQTANSELLVHAIAPRVAIMNNGIRKGGAPAVMRILYSSPGLEGLWQLHFSQFSGQEYNAPGLFIANLWDEPQSVMPIAPINPQHPGEVDKTAPIHNGKAYWIKVSAREDGSFNVMNGRTGFSRTYGAPGTAPGY